MDKVLKKQKQLKKIMNILCIFTATFLFVYIGVEPMLTKNIGKIPTIVIGYFSDCLIISCMVLLFIYYSKYGKCERFLESVGYELSDVGYYLTARQEKSINDYAITVLEDLKNNGYKINSGVEIDGLEFDYIATKGKEWFYFVIASQIDRNDIIAYTQSAIYDVTAVNVKRKGNGVVLFICDIAEEDAIELSKMITPLGRKEQIKFANAILEVSNSRCYFLGNNETKCQQMIANYVMNCELPIKEQYKSGEQLPFQNKLKDRMKEFNLKDFKNGTFYFH